MSSTRDRQELRQVQAADPALSPETNEMLTAELREIVGAEQVYVPRDRPHATLGEYPDRQGAGAVLNQHRFNIIRAALIVLTFAAIVALATGDWWILPLAAAIHALGTMTVTLTIIRMTTVTEHPSAELAAAMTEDGVPSPDERFTQMVEEFSQRQRGGASEVVSPGSNERTAQAGTDAPTAAAEQATAMTPTAEASEPAGEGGAPDVVIWVTWAALLVLSLAISAVFGGWMWLLAAVMIPLLAAWAVVQWLMIKHPERARLGPRGLVAVAGCTVIGVAVFCVVVALAFQP
jgi:hypothetical protein